MDLPHARIKHVIAVGSGKGGVGKSTIALNLAIALKELGYKVGLLDADLMGPSIPDMLGLSHIDQPEMDSGIITPIEKYGIKIMSMGLLMDDTKPLAVRGAMISKYIKLFFTEVLWGDLDYLIIDLPPGTGDTQISMCQTVSLLGAIIVTTPQDISLKVATKGLKLFELVDVPVLGIIENMSGFICSNCGHETHIFGRDGGAKLSTSLEKQFLGKVPLDSAVVEASDRGEPIILYDANSKVSQSYLSIARCVAQRMTELSVSYIKPFVWDWESGAGSPESRGDIVDNTRVMVIKLQKKDSSTLEINWNDGKHREINMHQMRVNCKCAICKTNPPVLKDARPVKIYSVGNYAIRVIWNDNHNTGIYSFKSLREEWD